MNKIVIIDGDSICYFCSKDTIEESIANVDSIMNTIMDETDSDSYVLYLSQGKYFRHQVNLEYKGNRKGKVPLKFLRTLKAYLRDRYKGISVEGLEADDMVSYIMWSKASQMEEEGIKLVYASPDKDVLRTVPGEHFNYRNQEVGEVTPAEANAFLLKQVLMGDAGDNIKGIPGIGAKKAATILEGALTVEEGIKKIIDAYLDYYCVKQGLSLGAAMYSYQQNFRQVYLLRTAEDLQNEVGKVPTLPTPIIFNELE